MKKLINSLKWLDANILKILFIAFIVLIPLYPKLPLIFVEYTYIYIRAEDFFMVLLTSVFFIQLLRRKVELNRKFLIPVMLFWLAVFLSFLNGFYNIKTIPVASIGLLHSLRRIEYMIIFFVAISMIKSAKDFIFYLKIILGTLVVAALYGLGQKLFGWPAVQTMNPEYARGYLLFLTPEARISSTFAGHYDFASYLVFFMPVALAYYFLKEKFRFFFIFFFSLVALVLTASRVSYIAYILATLPFLIFMRKPKTLILVVVLTVGLTLLSNNLTSRLKRTFQVKRILVDQRTGAVYIPQQISTKELPAGSFYLRLKDQKTTTPQTASEVEKYKQSVIIEKQLKATKSGEKIDVASLEANLKPVNTVVSDISFATRLQVEWPRAIKAFLYFPLLGTGPSSITEATDNDYLRWIGEFGILGTSIFLIILFLIGLTVLRKALEKNNKNSVLLWGYLFGLVALMVNASYIDVFEASKVAFIFWLTSGMYIGLCQLKIRKNNS